MGLILSFISLVKESLESDGRKGHYTSMHEDNRKAVDYARQFLYKVTHDSGFSGRYLNLVKVIQTRELHRSRVPRRAFRFSLCERRSPNHEEKQLMKHRSSEKVPNTLGSLYTVKGKYRCMTFLSQDTIACAIQDSTIALMRIAPDYVLYETNRITAFNNCTKINDIASTSDGRCITLGTNHKCLSECTLYTSDTGAYGTTWNAYRLDSSHSTASRMISAIRYNHDETTIMAAACDGFLYVVSRDRENSSPLHVIKADSAADALCCDPSAQMPWMIITGGQDGVCRIWDRRLFCVSFATPVGAFVGHQGSISYIDSKGDGRYFLSNSFDQTIKIWDIRHFSTDQNHYPKCTTKAAFASTMSIDRDYSLITIRGNHDTINYATIRSRFSPGHTGGRYIYTGSFSGKVVVYDFMKMEAILEYNGHTGLVPDCYWQPSSNRMFTLSWDGMMSVWYHPNYDKPLMPPYTGFPRDGFFVRAPNNELF